MTNIDMLMGMGCIDDQLVDEALNYKKTSRSSAVKWGALAACIGIAVLVGVFAMHRGGLPEEKTDLDTPVMTSMPEDDLPEEQPASLYGLQYTVKHQEDEAISLTLVKLGDSAAYTDILCESDGFQLISRESTATGERFLLRIASNHPKKLAAIFTIHLMNGSEECETLYFYGINTESGVFVDESLKSVWSSYYENRYSEGEYTDEEYRLIEEAIQSAPQSVREDPLPDLTEDENAPDGVFRYADGRIVGRYEGTGETDYIEVYIDGMGAGAGMGAAEINYPAAQAGDHLVQVYVGGRLTDSQTITVPAS